MVRVRFAPSPTGYLHLGNIRTALFNYLYAKKHGGELVLRIEDTDRERSRPEYLDAFLQDLLWMGIRWDEGPEVGGEYGPYLQSERMDIYKDHVDKLIKEGKAYYCYVTEEETEQMKHFARLEKRPPRFDNRGRNFTKEEIEERKSRGIKPTVRFKIENPQLKINDLVRGEVSFNLDDMVGDFVIQRADGNPTFHLVVCIDDALMKISHVIRGEDHLSNTPKHMLLYEAMGYTPPQFGHLSLVHGPGGEPLSKRIESVSVKEFRRKGYLPYALANYISLLGWSPGDGREVLTWKELQELFDLTRVSRSSSNFDPNKLDWLNGEHLRSLPNEDFTRLAITYLKDQGKLEEDADRVSQLLPIFQDNIERFEQLDERLEVLSDEFAYENEDEWIRADGPRKIFQEALGVLKDIDATAVNYEDFLNDLKPRVEFKGKKLFMPLRVAITGKEHGPELKRIFPVLGTDHLCKRLERALQT